jgi:dTDP-4-dehydrorhamnose reductase
MKLLVTGASGLYGLKLTEIATKEGHQTYSAYSQHQTAHGTPVQIEISNKEQVFTRVKEIDPEVVIHAASLTDVDKCELNKPLAWKINVEGAENVANAAKACGAYLLYISTDYVFDGEKGCYTETDLPSPISYYSYTKLKAEERIAKILDNCCLARPSVIYGAGHAAGKINFALWLLEKLRKREQTKVFVDQWNSPTLNSSLAEMTLEVAERRLTGIYHLAGATRISRYEFAQQLAQVFSLDPSVFIAASKNDVHLLAKRPRDSSLNTAKAESILKNKPLQLEPALKRLKAETDFSS